MTAGAVLAVLAVLAPAVPAIAGTAAVRDRAGDSREAMDLRRLVVRHAEPTGPRRLVLKARHGGFPSLGSGTFTAVTFFIDIDRADRGPEFVFDISLNTGGLFLQRVRGWKRGGAQIVPCRGLRGSADVFTDGPVVLKVPRSCLGDPRRVRAAVRSVGESRGGDVVVRDWVGAWRQWSPWVRR